MQMSIALSPLRWIWRTLPVTCAVTTGIFILFYSLRSSDIITWTQVTGPSLPNGLYDTYRSDTLIAGLPMLLCLEGRAGRIAVSRNYAKRTSWAGICPDGATVVKIIAAIPGDTVLVKRDSVRVNQRAWLHAPMMDHDSQGRSMEHATGRFILDDHECYALSLWSPRSYDSRYFGPFPCPDPIRIAIPLDSTKIMILDSLRIVTLQG